MDENTIFQDKQDLKNEMGISQPESQPETQANQPLSEPLPLSPVPPPPPPLIEPQPAQEAQPSPSAPILPSVSNPILESSIFPPSFFQPSTIIKAVVGLLLLIVVGFVLVRFVVPSLTPEKKENVELIYWGLWEGENVIKSVLSQFERENPTIKIQYKKQDIKQYKDRLVTQTQAGKGPDVFRFHNTWLPMLSDVLLPISNDVMRKEEFQKTFYPVAAQDLIKNGAIYGIPLQIDTLSLFVNTEILQSAAVAVPQTWDEFSQVVRKLTVVDEEGRIKTAGVAMGTFDNITHASDIMSLLFVQNGADLNNLSKTSQSASDALAFYTSFAKPPGNVWDETLDPSVLAFAKGNLALYFGYSWDIFTIKAINPNLAFEVHPVPVLSGRDMTIASYWIEGLSVKSTHQKEALLLLKFLVKKETQQKLFSEASKTRLFGEPYSRQDLAESLRNNPLVYPFVSQAKDAVSSFFASDTYDNGLNSQMNAYLGNAVRSVLGNTSPETAVETLSSGVTQVLQQYQPQK